MPELPEVETIRRQLEPELTGRRLESVEVLDERWTRPLPPSQLVAACEGKRVERVGRRGKYLVLRLGGGIDLIIHLRMTGSLILVGEDEARDERHLRARLGLDDGRELRFTDLRRFGTALALPAEQTDAYFASRVGVEPLSDEFTPALLAEIAAGRSAPLKSFLLMQTGVAGVGNIYADEALHRAELHPLSPAGSMRAEHCEALHEGIVGALEAGLSNGGASIDDYLDARGEQGSMQDEFLVHTREGEPCPRCGETIRRIVVGGRSTYFCPRCQVRLRKRPKRRTVRGRGAP